MTVLLIVAASLVWLAPPASADVGDCVTVRGKNNTSSNGWAEVCLNAFYWDGEGCCEGEQVATLHVTQRKRSAPHNVYVQAWWVDAGVTSIGMGRLGPNSNEDGEYTKTKRYKNPDLDGVRVALCYDKTAQSDPCYSKKTLWEYGDGKSGGEKPDGTDSTAPVLGKPVATLAHPTSRTANYSIEATDDVGVTGMRVRATGDAEWRPWVAYQPTGTVILPDRYGEFTIWFQVRDAAGNASSQRAADNVTRVQDTTAPTLGKPVVTHDDPASRTVSFSLDAADDMGTVSHLRVRVGPDEAEFRPWVDFVPSGTVILPDRYGTFTIWFQVMDPAGNVSFERAADNVTRTAAVGLNLQQVDNNGNVRSCGSTESTPCSNVVRKFRATISGDLLPKTDLLVKLWRYVNGAWVETDPSPYARYAISGPTVNFEFPSGAVAGLWRVQVQVPRDDVNHTDFAASGYQYIQET